MSHHTPDLTMEVKRRENNWLLGLGAELVDREKMEFRQSLKEPTVNPDTQVTVLPYPYIRTQQSTEQSYPLS